MPVIDLTQSPTAPGTAYNDKALKDAIAQLAANETIDDQTVAALETLVKAKDAAHDSAITDLKLTDATTDASLKILGNKIDAIKLPDLSPYAKKSEIPSAIASTAEITPIFDPLPAPTPMVTPVSISGATLVANEVGSKLVDNARVHSFGRTSTPPAPNTWTGTITIPPTTGACKIRWGIFSVLPGTIEVTVDNVGLYTASNTGSGWSSASPTIQVYIDGNYTWFEIAVAQQNVAFGVMIKIPTGRGLLPTIYAPNAITTLTPAEPTALRLTDPRTGKEMVYRPSDLALASTVAANSAAVTANATAIANNATAIANLQFSKVADTAWFNTNFDPRYLRKVSKAKITSLTLEYKQQDGTVQQFSLTDFVTSFTNSGFWNGAQDPNGVTRFVTGPEVVVVSWDGTGENLTLAVPKGAGYLQIRKVRVNGQPMDWLSVYEPPIPTVPKDKLSYIVNGGAQDQAVPANGTVFLDTVNKLINPDNLTDLAFVANGRVVFPVDGRVSVTGTFYRTTATGVVEPVLFVYKGSSATTKMQFNQTGIMANGSSCHLQCAEFTVNAGDTMAILCPQAVTVWKANCRLSVVYV